MEILHRAICMFLILTKITEGYKIPNPSSSEYSKGANTSNDRKELIELIIEINNMNVKNNNVFYSENKEYTVKFLKVDKVYNAFLTGDTQTAFIFDMIERDFLEEHPHFVLINNKSRKLFMENNTHIINRLRNREYNENAQFQMKEVKNEFTEMWGTNTYKCIIIANFREIDKIDRKILLNYNYKSINELTNNLEKLSFTKNTEIEVWTRPLILRNDIDPEKKDTVWVEFIRDKDLDGSHFNDRDNRYILRFIFDTCLNISNESNNNTINYMNDSNTGVYTRSSNHRLENSAPLDASSKFKHSYELSDPLVLILIHVMAKNLIPTSYIGQEDEVLFFYNRNLSCKNITSVDILKNYGLYFLFPTWCIQICLMHMNRKNETEFYNSDNLDYVYNQIIRCFYIQNCLSTLTFTVTEASSTIVLANYDSMDEKVPVLESFDRYKPTLYANNILQNYHKLACSSAIIANVLHEEQEMRKHEELYTALDEIADIKESSLIVWKDPLNYSVIWVKFRKSKFIMALLNILKNKEKEMVDALEQTQNKEEMPTEYELEQLQLNIAKLQELSESCTENEEMVFPCNRDHLIFKKMLSLIQASLLARSLFLNIQPLIKLLNDII
ncbi:hypothetical protein NEMIN01_1628 [Nematocida minor]|uniref:uncharacterized protein n=1 Tax=Nematocida minor TaxID=1912983 RepID=UPI002220C694|nr:uncharacterized protein NEMIN01_1628 [Nematocida minor]KAI5191695.1 hypothetical protein NEMIN01_1628 [Nematocida minor]